MVRVNPTGDNFVLFNATAIEVYHNKDNENQILFWTGDVDPTTMVFAKGVEGTDKYTVYQNGQEVFTGTYEEIVEKF